MEIERRTLDWKIAEKWNEDTWAKAHLLFMSERPMQTINKELEYHNNSSACDDNGFTIATELPNLGRIY
jgi:hypothetical protein